jgi:hypothetical protein
VDKRIKSDDDDEPVAAPVIKVVKPVKLASTYISCLVNDEIENLIAGEDNKNMAQILMPYKMNDKQYAACAEKLQPLLAEYSEVLELRRTDRKTLTEEQIEFMDSFPFPGITLIKKIVQVRAVKFLVEDPKFGKSVDPINLLNCSEVWAFDTKTRKISKYYSPVGGGITVKGASLVGYDEAMSSCKLLRKPEEQIPAFSATAKKDLTKWYSSVKSKNANVRPRLTATTLILKVF